MKEKIDVYIEDYDYFGRGISKKTGKICFVPKVRKGYSASCKLVKSTKSYDEAVLNEEDYLSLSCPYFYQCGGCQLRHLNQEEQEAFKALKVQKLFFQNANMKIDKPSITPTSFNHYRNKASFHIENGKVGYFKEGTHELLEVSACLLLNPKINEVLEELKVFAKKAKRKMEATVRAFHDEVMLDLKEDITHPLDFAFKSVDSLYYQGELIFGSPFLEVQVLGITFQVSCDAFFQVNLEGMEVLYQKVITLLKEKNSQKVLDLYCGVGSISLVVAASVREVYGVEVIKSAVSCAQENARNNKIKNAKFVCGRVEDLLDTFPQGYDTIIVDPPRRGLDKKTKQFLLEQDFKTMIYISCDAATLARDVKDLSEKYKLEKIELVDMFPNTYHVESLCVLRAR